MMDSQSTSRPDIGDDGARIWRRLKLRLRGAVVAAVSLGALLLGRWLAPRASGYGTHEQLGLPACSFLARTRWPCPSCGLTTSFAAMAHGDLVGAFWAHPFGIVLFSSIAILASVGAAELVAGRDLITKLRPGLLWVGAAAAGLLVGWGLKLLIGYSTGRLPV